MKADGLFARMGAGYWRRIAVAVVATGMICLSGCQDHNYGGASVPIDGDDWRSQRPVISGAQPVDNANTTPKSAVTAPINEQR